VEGAGELFGAGEIEMRAIGYDSQKPALHEAGFLFWRAKRLTFSVFLLFLCEATFTFFGEAKLS
jgi:hypothetical protein